MDSEHDLLQDVLGAVAVAHAPGDEARAAARGTPPRSLGVRRGRSGLIGIHTPPRPHRRSRRLLDEDDPRRQRSGPDSPAAHSRAVRPRGRGALPYTRCRIASTTMATGGSVYSTPPWTHTRHAVSAPQPSVHASEPHGLSRSSRAMSSPSTRIVGELTKRNARRLLRRLHQHLVDLDLDAGRSQHVTHRLKRRLEAPVGAETAGAGRAVKKQEIDPHPVQDVRTISGGDRQGAHLGISRRVNSLTHTDGADPERTHRARRPAGGVLFRVPPSHLVRVRTRAPTERLTS